MARRATEGDLTDPVARGAQPVARAADTSTKNGSARESVKAVITTR